MIVFDYIFYRIAKFYYKKDGLSAESALLVLSFIQAALLGEIVFKVARIIKPDITNNNNSQLSSYIGVMIGCMFYGINYFRYKNMYWKLSDRWKNSDTKLMYKFKGVLVVIAILLPFIILFLMSEIEFL